MAAALTNLSWMQDGLKSTLNVAPTNHVGAINNVCMNVLAYGGKIVFHHRVDLEAIAALTEREQLTYLVGIPTAFAMFAAMPEPGLQRFGNDKLVVFGDKRRRSAGANHQGFAAAPNQQVWPCGLSSCGV